MRLILNFRFTTLLLMGALTISLPAPAASDWVAKLKGCVSGYWPFGSGSGRVLVPSPRPREPYPLFSTARKFDAESFLENHYPNAKVEFLSAGGESLVYVVTPPGGEPFVVRFPSYDRGKSPFPKILTTEQRYFQEVRLLKEVNVADGEGASRLVQSKQVVPLGEPGRGDVAIETEYIPGGDLAQNIQIFGPNASDREILKAFRDVAIATRALHRANWIHQDLNPGNIYVRAKTDGVELALGDFGYAAPKGGHAAESHSGDLVGTPRYMSPDQAAGKKANESFDLFAMKLTFGGIQKGHLFDGTPQSVAVHAPDQRLHPGACRVLSNDFKSLDEVITQIDRELAVAK